MMVVTNHSPAYLVCSITGTYTIGITAVGRGVNNNHYYRKGWGVRGGEGYLHTYSELLVVVPVRIIIITEYGRGTSGGRTAPHPRVGSWSGVNVMCVPHLPVGGGVGPIGSQDAASAGKEREIKKTVGPPPSGTWLPSWSGNPESQSPRWSGGGSGGEPV